MTLIPKLTENDTIQGNGGSSPGYRITRYMATGGVGRIYLAKSIETGERLVIKIPKEWDCTFDVFQEARYLLGQSLVNVANIQTVDYGLISRPGLDWEIPYLVMDEYQTSLAVHLQEVRAVDRDRALRWTSQVALALQSSKLLHRDVKPENILLDGDLNAWLSDFGLALPANPFVREKAGIKPMGLMGTAAYMAPEQIIEAPNIDHRADIYALGLILFEMITGKTANPRKTISQSLDDYYDMLLDYRVRWEEVQDPKIAEIVRTCTEKTRPKRYADYWYLLKDIDQALKA